MRPATAPRRPGRTTPLQVARSPSSRAKRRRRFRSPCSTTPTTRGGVETLSLTLSNAEGAQIADTIATGTVADDESQQPVEALTASFENVPESHDGSTEFTFEVHFSEEPAGLSYVK